LIDFAIWFDKVPEWSNPNFIEGVFIVIVGNKFLPEVIQESATLLVQLGDFDWILSKLNEYKENVEDDICKEDLYFRAHNPRFVDNTVGKPQGVVVAPMYVRDSGWDIYLFGANKDERLIYSKDNGKTVFEKRLPRGTIEKVLSSLPKPEDIRIIGVSVEFE